MARKTNTWAQGNHAIAIEEIRPGFTFQKGKHQCTVMQKVEDRPDYWNVHIFDPKKARARKQEIIVMSEREICDQMVSNMNSLKALPNRPLEPMVVEISDALRKVKLRDKYFSPESIEKRKQNGSTGQRMTAA